MTANDWILPWFMLVRIMYIMLNNLHRSITSWFTGSATKINMLGILTYLPFIALGLSYIYFTSFWMLGVSMYSLSQIVSSKGRRRWILMDVTICLPALYPLRYVVDHLEYRSPSTQSASLQAIKFFYDFWFIKHRTTFCYSFYFSGHDPAIAIHEMTDFFQYLENGRLVSFAPRALPFKHSSCMTNASRVRAVIRFIGYLIATYVSPGDAANLLI